ncbi:MAG: hypothetical protein H6Q89_2518 [Myxococcaceae bacterium]|nr:hypothetical protein [Myxococcaceae bacterium]
MERKGSNAAVVTAEEVTTALKGRIATQEEEKVLRMRYGSKVETGLPLPKAAGTNEELGDELLLIEMQLFRAMKARRGLSVAPAPVTRNAAKDKIVRSLKSKKK